MFIQQLQDICVWSIFTCRLSPPLHVQHIGHHSWEQLQEALLHPDVLQLQWISRSMSRGTDGISGCTVR